MKSTRRLSPHICIFLCMLASCSLFKNGERTAIKKSERKDCEDVVPILNESLFEEFKSDPYGLSGIRERNFTVDSSFLVMGQFVGLDTQCISRILGEADTIIAREEEPNSRRMLYQISQPVAGQPINRYISYSLEFFDKDARVYDFILSISYDSTTVFRSTTGNSDQAEKLNGIYARSIRYDASSARFGSVEDVPVRQKIMIISGMQQNNPGEVDLAFVEKKIGKPDYYSFKHSLTGSLLIAEYHRDNHVSQTLMYDFPSLILEHASF